METYTVFRPGLLRANLLAIRPAVVHRLSSLTACHPYGFQARDLKLPSNVTPEEPAVSGGGVAVNAEVYVHLVCDVHAGTYSTLGFDHALITRASPKQ